MDGYKGSSKGGFGNKGGKGGGKVGRQGGGVVLFATCSCCVLLGVVHLDCVKRVEGRVTVYGVPGVALETPTDICIADLRPSTPSYCGDAPCCLLKS